MSNHIIETERHGLWIAVALVVSLLGLLIGLAGIVRVHQLGVASQIEVLALNKRIVALEKMPAAAAAPAAPVAPAEPATAP